MKIFKEYDQKQTYLLPPSLEEFVGPEHPARQEKSERRISPDVFGSQYWEDNQQNTESCRAREGMLQADHGCGWLKIEEVVFFILKLQIFGVVNTALSRKSGM